ncbi:MAG: response regulator [Bradyrhizobiaceae bacterium]|nr:response regulator [Hyphomicrobiales bacterium]MBV9427510.1 response regulator [Bradyrhizobiaceae bacterium]
MRRAKPTRAARKRTRGRRASKRPRQRQTPAIEAALAAFAHEVRTPLTGILALSELLAASDLPERERGWAAAVKSAADHLAQLTTLVVGGSKAATRAAALRREAIRPRVLAEALAATLTARAETKGLTTEIRIGTLPEAAIGDPVLLRAAVENLIDNAVKFTERGKVGLEVTAEPAARNRVRLIFAVSDSGIGLAPAEIRRLFRPFSQATAQIAGRFGGAGLGLVFVKRVAQAMRGKVTVESKPGAGSTFRLAVTIGAAAPESGRPNTAASGLTARGTRALRILCAEDNPYGRVILNTILTELGHKVDFAATGEAAVEAVARGGYDLVLMDVILPGVDGIEATRRIRTREDAAARTPIIGISGRAAPGDEANARAAGMDAYLMKPVSPSRLAEVIAATTAR